MVTHADSPIFSAVSGSARQLFSLLRTIRFSSRALVQISDAGLRLSGEDARAMEGTVFLERSLFATYNFQPPRRTAPHDAGDDNDEAEDEITPFEISLTALLEVIQLFGITDTTKTGQPVDHGSMSAFDPRLVGMTSVCRLVYSHTGGPLVVVISEGTVSSSASLTAYEPQLVNEIQFDRQSLALKIIMKSSALFEAVGELAISNPTRLTVVALARNSSLSLIASTEAGSTVVDFLSELPSRSSQKPGMKTGSVTNSSVLETFLMPEDERVVYSYKFGLIKQAARAMAMATKLSLRIDQQGVLNMQFMIELEDTTAAAAASRSSRSSTDPPPATRVAFVDFRFVPLLSEEDLDYEGEAGVGANGLDQNLSQSPAGLDRSRREL